MNKTERMIYEIEREEEKSIYSVTYYNNDKEQHGLICENYDQVLDFLQTLMGWRHIDILRFKREEL